MANTVCCTAVDPTTEAHTSLSASALLPSHHLSILHGKIHLPPHGKMQDENANVKERGLRGLHTEHLPPYTLRTPLHTPAPGIRVADSLTLCGARHYIFF
ncbi:hypothetical protein AVEN_194787-1 [Araneus ventricosus]|uniref:Uncharacterized protein n=1 Tax=Araneus ventricosus TaxID=182803 RepID=A0A4Y2B5F2_ARAVE|nr:hypothetical protein AVEN_194787-1 [Araneus ventricosus]